MNSGYKNSFFSPKNIQNIAQNVPHTDPTIIKKHMHGVWNANAQKCPKDMSENQFISILNNKIIQVCKKQQQATNLPSQQSMQMGSVNRHNENPPNSNSGNGDPPQFSTFQSNMAKVGPANLPTNTTADSGLDDAFAKKLQERSLSFNGAPSLNDKTSTPPLPKFLESMSTTIKEEIESTDTITNQAKKVNTAMNRENIQFDQPPQSQSTGFESLPIESINNISSIREARDELPINNIIPERSAPDQQSIYPSTNIVNDSSLIAKGLNSNISHLREVPTQVAIDYQSPLPKPGQTNDVFLQLEKQNNETTKQNIRDYYHVISIDSYWRQFSYDKLEDGSLKYMGGNGSIATFVFQLGQNEFNDSNTQSTGNKSIIYNHPQAGVVSSLNNLKNVIEVYCINGFAPLKVFDLVKQCPSNYANDEEAPPGNTEKDCDDAEDCDEDEDCDDNDCDLIPENKGKSEKKSNYNLAGIVSPYIYVVIDEFEGNVSPTFTTTTNIPNSLQTLAKQCNVKSFTPGSKAFAILKAEYTDKCYTMLTTVSGSVYFNELRSFDKLTIRFYDSLGYPLLWPTEDMLYPTEQYIPLSKQECLEWRIGLTLKLKCLRKSRPINIEMLN